MAPAPHTSQRYRSKRSQRGEAELAIFAIVVLIAALISGTFWILQWVKENKYSEREARKLEYIRQMKMSKYANRRDPAEYLARCEKPFWAILRTEYTCRVLPESYGELWLYPY